MDQQSTSLWHATSVAPRFDPLRGELEVDVVVIGAGITGLTASLLLADRGKRVAVLERETLAGGETGNTAAHITVALDAGYRYIRRKYSTEEAKLAANAQQSAVDTIAELVERYAIDCHYKRVPGYGYTEKRKYVSELKSEAAAAREAGLDAQWTDQVPLPFATRGAVLWPNQAQFHPREYLTGLAKQAVAAGVKIYERTQVFDVKNGEPCDVETTEGRVVAASVILTDTAHEHASAARIYTIACSAAADPVPAVFWDTADQQHATWREGAALVVRGEEQPVEAQDESVAYAQLEEYVRQLYGDVELLERRSGVIRKTPDGLPISTVDGNVFAVTGFGRREVTLAVLAAMVTVDVVTGAVSPWAALFDPRRFEQAEKVQQPDREPPAASTDS